MKKKYFFQLALVILIVFLLIVFMLYYNNNENNNSSDLSIIKDLDKIKKSTDNIIKDIRYFSKDDKGNNYEIVSDFGEISLDNPDLIFMTNVVATINLKNSSNVVITSKFANFNNKSYETTFYENVKILRDDEKIRSQKLEFSLEKDLILISNNVVLEKPGFNLKADRVEIDLITKNSKILMNDSNKKVIAIGKNE